jgi:hypothetical protein
MLTPTAFSLEDVYRRFVQFAASAFRVQKIESACFLKHR